MRHELSEGDIEKLLSGLLNSDVYFRNLAVESIGRQKVTDERIINALKSIASLETNEYVKKAAVMILINSGILSPIWEDKPNFSKTHKVNDFWYGFGLFFGVNILMGLIVWLLANLLSPSNTVWLNFSPLLIDLGLIIYFAFSNRDRTALGMLAWFGIAFGIVICLGLLYMATCFSLS